MAEPTYPYGDTPAAGDRLDRLAEVFEPSTAAFLDAAAIGDRRRPDPIELAVDLGCGPGHTTRLLAECTGARHTVGLEASAAFVARARHDRPAVVTLDPHRFAGRRGGDPSGTLSGLSFRDVDVTVLPWPIGPADVVFARYLLAHLPDAAGLIGGWVGQLAPGGRLLVEEIVSIDTEHPVLGRYVQLVTALSAAHGNDLLVGASLGNVPTPAGTTVVHDEVVRIAPPVATMAGLFGLNLSQWRHDPWAQATLDPAELDTLAEQLAALVEDPPPPGTITWRHRQLAWSSGRAGPPSGRLRHPTPTC